MRSPHDKGVDSSPLAETFSRREQGLISFGVDIRLLLSSILGKKGFIEADIISRWENISGSVLSAGTQPFSVTRLRSDGSYVLHIKACSGAYAMELSARKPQIIAGINAYFGYEAVKDLRITQGSICHPKFITRSKRIFSSEEQDQAEAATCSINDPALRKAAYELGLYVLCAKNN